MTGSVLGASSRWSVNELLPASTADGRLPWATLAVNLVGCAAIGVLAGRLTGVARTFAVTGVLGGFTTMSTFAVEVDQLVDVGARSTAFLYVTVSIVGGLLLAAAGIRSGRGLVRERVAR